MYTLNFNARFLEITGSQGLQRFRLQHVIGTGYEGGVCVIVLLTFRAFAWYPVPLTQFRNFAPSGTFSQSGSHILYMYMYICTKTPYTHAHLHACTGTYMCHPHIQAELHVCTSVPLKILHGYSSIDYTLHAE